jgi:hypothetical protein
VDVKRLFVNGCESWEFLTSATSLMKPLAGFVHLEYRAKTSTSESTRAQNSPPSARERKPEPKNSRPLNTCLVMIASRVQKRARMHFIRCILATCWLRATEIGKNCWFQATPWRAVGCERQKSGKSVGCKQHLGELLVVSNRNGEMCWFQATPAVGCERFICRSGDGCARDRNVMWCSDGRSDTLVWSIG